MWKHLPRFYFDLETTSKYPEQAWTIQLGTALEKDRQLRTGARWINPGCPVPADVVKAINLTAEELEKVAQAKPFASVAQQLHNALWTRPIVVGYNLITYDVEVLRREFRRLNQVMPERRYIDVMIFARHLVPAEAVESHKLALVAHHLGIKVEGHAHRADADCAMTAGILDWMLEQGHLPDDLDRLHELQHYLAGFGSFFQAAPGKPIALNCNSSQRPGIVYKGRPLTEVYREDPGFIR